jgi:hypothetical protein
MECCVTNRLSRGRLLVPFLAVVLAACQPGGGVGRVLGIGGGANPSQEDIARITEAELRAFCPQVALSGARANFRTYARGGEGDPDRIVYLAALTDATRACRPAGETMAITVALAGRVVPGPAVVSGTITMPILVEVIQGEEVIYSRRHDYKVAIDAASAATQFVFTDPDIVIPAPRSRNIAIVTGFDIKPEAQPL